MKIPRQAQNLLGRIVSGIWDWDASRPTRERATGHIPHADDPKQELTQRDRRELLRFSRWLYKNSGVVHGAINDMATYSVGKGILLHAQSRDETFNEQAEALWNEWSKIADVRGQLDLRELTLSWSRAIDRDGEVFVILTEDRFGIPHLQTVSSHNVKSDDFNAPENEHDGVATNSAGRPVAYIVNGRRVAARDILHIYDPMYHDALRGVSSLACCINNLFDIREILKFEKQGVKLNSAIATTIKTNQPADGAGFLGNKSKADSANEKVTLEQIIGGGTIPRLAPGEELESHTSNRPSPTFDGFINHFIRDLASGIGLPYEFIWDPTNLSGTTNRFVLEKAQRRFEQRQETIIKHLNRVYTWFISKQIERGTLPRVDQWWKAEWSRPRKITVDAGRQSKANIEEIKAGLKTYAEDYAERGLNWREQLRQRAQEEAFIEQLANDLNVDRVRITQRTPNETANIDDDE